LPATAEAVAGFLASQAKAGLAASTIGLAALKTERATVIARGRQIETEAAPIRYVADLIGASTDSELSNPVANRSAHSRHARSVQRYRGGELREAA
jgi:hypothetical protein